jgi:tryptophan synthase beta chain
MGVVDMARQAPNVLRMRLLGAEVVGVDSGSQTLKDAINEAMRDWTENVATTHYVLGSALGPHPYPILVRELQSVIGREARAQFRRLAGRDPHAAVACVGGGSNAIGLFSAYLASRVRLFGVEAGGRGTNPGDHAARFSGGRVGILHGTRTMLLQDAGGQVPATHSVSAGLDYPAVGPEHAELAKTGRVEYVTVGDAEALDAFELLSRQEGIIPALESAHAVAFAATLARRMPKSAWILVNLSGRGDKDLAEVERVRSAPGGP